MTDPTPDMTSETNEAIAAPRILCWPARPAAWSPARTASPVPYRAQSAGRRSTTCGPGAFDASGDHPVSPRHEGDLVTTEPNPTTEPGPDEYPEGAPLLTPYPKIRPRSKLAQFKRRFAEVAALQERVTNAMPAGAFEPDASTAGKLAVWADADALLAAMDELMALAAVNPEAYREWSDQADDDALLAAFTAYMARSQPKQEEAAS